MKGGSETSSEIEIAMGYEHPIVVDEYWTGRFPTCWDFKDVDDILAVIAGVMRDKKKRPEIHKLKVANCLEGKDANYLREEESKRCIDKAIDNEGWAKEQERLEGFAGLQTD